MSKLAVSHPGKSEAALFRRVMGAVAAAAELETEAGVDVSEQPPPTGLL